MDGHLPAIRLAGQYRGMLEFKAFVSGWKANRSVAGPTSARCDFAIGYAPFLPEQSHK